MILLFVVNVPKYSHSTGQLHTHKGSADELYTHYYTYKRNYAIDMKCCSYGTLYEGKI